MKEKELMTSFFLAGTADIATTAVGLNLPGFREIGVIGSNLVESNNTPDAFIIRTAVTAGMIGIYALTKHHGSKWSYSVEKALQIGNIISWSAVLLNAAQMAPNFVELLKK